VTNSAPWFATPDTVVKKRTSVFVPPLARANSIDWLDIGLLIEHVPSSPLKKGAGYVKVLACHVFVVVVVTVVYCQHICVPSAYRTYSPLALLPRSIIAPVGTPADWDTVPRMLLLVNILDQVPHEVPLKVLMYSRPLRSPAVIAI
jgi:hypothetical protein